MQRDAAPDLAASKENDSSAVEVAEAEFRHAAPESVAGAEAGFDHLDPAFVGEEDRARRVPVAVHAGTGEFDKTAPHRRVGVDSGAVEHDIVCFVSGRVIGDAEAEPCQLRQNRRIVRNSPADRDGEVSAAGEQCEVLDDGVAEDRGAVEQFCPGEGTVFFPEADLCVESRMLFRTVEGTEIVGNTIDIHDGNS